ncbi:hypothetical protein, partial [Vibrio sp.]|uniref:hypothetical protein n=1 Tax=Vibrio sp. TaxID=678 RepID=UPI003D099795
FCGSVQATSTPPRCRTRTGNRTPGSVCRVGRNGVSGTKETWYVPPGSVSVFELKLNVPGNYLLVDHALYRVSKGAAGILTATGNYDDSIYAPLPEQ